MYDPLRKIICFFKIFFKLLSNILFCLDANDNPEPERRPGSAADISGVYLYLVRERMWLLLHYSDILIIIQFTVSPRVTSSCAILYSHVTLSLTSLEMMAVGVTLFQARQVNTWVRWVWAARTSSTDTELPLPCLNNIILVSLNIILVICFYIKIAYQACKRCLTKF